MRDGEITPHRLTALRSVAEHPSQMPKFHQGFGISPITLQWLVDQGHLSRADDDRLSLTASGRSVVFSHER